MFKYIVVTVFALLFFVDAYKNVPEIAKENSPVLNDLSIADAAAERLALEAPVEEILVAEDVPLNTLPVADATSERGVLVAPLEENLVAEDVRLNVIPIADAPAERLALGAPVEEILVAEDVALEGPARRKRSLDTILVILSGIIPTVPT